MIIRYIVIATDIGSGVDGKPSVHGVFKTEDDAKQFVHDEMDELKEFHKDAIDCDYDEMVLTFDDDIQTIWNIEKVAVPL